MYFFTHTDTLPTHINGLSRKKRPYEMLTSTADLIRGLQQGEYEEGEAYRLLVVMRPDLEPGLTQEMLSLGKEWRTPELIEQIAQYRQRQKLLRPQQEN